MSIWTQPEQDRKSVAPAQSSGGRRLGFLEGLEAAYDEAWLFTSQFGAEYATYIEEQENIRRIREAGGTPPPSLLEDATVFDRATFLQRAYTPLARAAGEGGSPDEVQAVAGTRDEQLRALQQKYPDAGIRTYQEMFDDVRRQSDAARLRGQRDTTFGGAVGAFIGGMGGAVDPRVSPTNFLTLPIGFGAGTVLRRIGAQVAGQSVIESINQFTGVRENMRILGGDPTLWDSASQIAMAGVFSGTLQGVGEVGRFAYKRWFNSTADDPAPPPPVAEERRLLPPPEWYGRSSQPDGAVQTTRLPRGLAVAIDMALPYLRSPSAEARAGRPGARADFEAAHRQMDDWAGPPAWHMAPPTATRLPGDFGIDVPRVDPDAVKNASIDVLARRADPEVFKMYDKLAATKNTLQRWIEELKGPRHEQAMAKVADIDAEIARLQAKTDGATKRNSKKYQQRISDLQKQRADIVEPILRQDTPDMARIRRQPVDADEKMRDLAPAVGRAYARARGKWDETDAEREAILGMLREGRTTLPEAPSMPTLDEALTYTYTPSTVRDFVPELRDRPARPGQDAADVAREVNAEQVKRLDDAAQEFLDTAGFLLARSDTNEVQVPGVETKVHLDEDNIYIGTPDVDGRIVTVREAIEEVEADNATMKAMQVCSRGPTS